MQEPDPVTHLWNVFVKIAAFSSLMNLWLGMKYTSEMKKLRITILYSFIVRSGNEMELFVDGLLNQDYIYRGQ